MGKHGTIKSRIANQQSIEGETWLPVYGYEGSYEVSDCGRVRRVETGLILSGAINQSGYFFVILCKNSVRKLARVHRLVAQSFIGQCPQGKEVNHKDAIKTNNNLSNLEYITHKENMEHRPYGKKQRRLKDSEVAHIKELLHSGQLTQRAIAKQFRVNEAIISRIKYGKIHNVYG